MLYYDFLLYKLINRSSKSLLDIGCGKGSSIVRLIHNKLKYRIIIGCDIYPQYVKESKHSGLYNECILADAHYLPFKPYSFDLVICLEVIEHLDKLSGEKLLSNIENIASKEIVFSTPVGLLFQGVVNNNPFQIHKSAWFPSEFRKRGYKVIGIAGPFFLRGYYKYSIYEKMIISMAGLISVILQPIFYFLPNVAFQMIIVKNKA